MGEVDKTLGNTDVNGAKKNAPDDCPASYAPPCEPGCDRACPVGGELEPTKEESDVTTG